MPCYSRITNTSMLVADRIVEAAQSFGWKVEMRNENYISIETKSGRFDLTRRNNTQNFSTSDSVDSHLNTMQTQYNVQVVKNWANKAGYNAKETKTEVKI